MDEKVYSDALTKGVDKAFLMGYNLGIKHTIKAFQFYLKNILCLNQINILKTNVKYFLNNQIGKERKA